MDISESFFLLLFVKMFFFGFSQITFSRITFFRITIFALLFRIQHAVTLVEQGVYFFIGKARLFQ